ncbi:MAG: type II toxin-antitoxin system VapC family toxin [Mesorhizobium sp.]|nr:MAG: type II toxin-antitoxin system VapC family toxin [Mesorhizobium sp.]
MIVLDTNVISDVFSRQRSQKVLNWLNAQEPATLFLSTIVFAELYFGAYLVQEAARRDGLLQSIFRIRGEFSGRILVFGDVPAEQYGRISATRRLAGKPIETKDAMIAAICLAHDATLATRNVRDFDGLDLKLVNPFEAGA